MSIFSQTSYRRIGLTGGIATGKTTVSNYLATSYQLPILDADIYARNAVSPDSFIFKNIIHHFGEKISLPDGSLDRRALGNIVFNDVTERRWLEQQIHPYVRECLREGSQDTAKTMVLVVPLLFEANMTDLCTEIWVVSCQSDLQIERLMQRDRVSRADAIGRIDAQMSLTAKCQLADVVLDNSSTLDSLLKQVDRALEMGSD
jgi:dephospho-CoA kinase